MSVDPKLHDEIRGLHAELCSGLSDPTRILILYILADKPLAVNELVRLLNTGQPTVSRHLQILRARNLVSAVREGNKVVYSLTDMRVIQALDLLREVMSEQIKHQAGLVEEMVINP